MSQMEAELNAVKAELAELKALVSRMAAPAAPAAQAEPVVSSRRQALKTIAVGTAGIFAGTSLLDATPAAAVNPSMFLNQENDSTALTELRIGSLSTATAALYVQDGTQVVTNVTTAAASIVGYSGGNVGVVGSSGSNAGVKGVSNAASETVAGVLGVNGQGGGVGVLATGGNGTGLIASGTTGAKLVGTNSNSASVRLMTGPSTIVQNPFIVANNRSGEVILQNNGDGTSAATPVVWLAIGNGQYYRLAGPGMAGGLTLLAAPVRVYDSRAGKAPTTVTKGKLPSGTSRDIDVKVNSSGVPTHARGIVGNLTVTDTGGGGFATAYPKGATRPNASSVNWTGPNQSVNNSLTVALGTSESFTLWTSSGANFVVDVVGYYL